MDWRVYSLVFGDTVEPSLARGDTEPPFRSTKGWCASFLLSPFQMGIQFPFIHSSRGILPLTDPLSFCLLKSGDQGWNCLSTQKSWQRNSMCVTSMDKKQPGISWTMGNWAWLKCSMQGLLVWTWNSAQGADGAAAVFKDFGVFCLNK